METVVVVAVVASRFLVPPLIPRFPLPGIVAALVIDAVDQTVFAAFDAEPANYQSYDKALDVYYLTVAYISTLRNWTDEAGYRVGQVLWYYRLVGVLVFELTQARVMLLVFPNTFEYYFIFYEVVRLWWMPDRLTRRRVIAVAAAIWIVVKLPQEWWIHVAQRDVTDTLAAHPWLYPVVGGALAAAAAAAWTQRWRLPPVDWRCTFDVDTHSTTVRDRAPDEPVGAWALINRPLVEKSLLVSLVCVIFSQIMPAVQVSNLQLAGTVTLVIVLNSLVSQWLIRRGVRWTTTASQFVAMGLINVGIVVGARVVLSGSDRMDATSSLVMLALLTLIVTLYDRYRSMRLYSHAVNPRGVEAR